MATKKIRVTGFKFHELAKCTGLQTPMDVSAQVVVDGCILVVGRGNVTVVEGGIEIDLYDDKPAPTRAPGGSK